MACERPAFQSILSHPVACERAVLRTCLSQESASPAAEKGEVKIANLSITAPVAGTFLEALSLMRSIAHPLVRARGAHCKTAAHRPKAKRRLSIGEEPLGSGCLRAKPLLILWRGSPKAPRQRRSQCGATCSSTWGVRALPLAGNIPVTKTSFAPLCYSKDYATLAHS